MSGETAARVIVRLVYMGQRWDGPKITHEWGLVDTDPIEARWFGKMKGAAVGGIYEVQAAGEDVRSVWTGTLHFTGDRHPDEQQRAVWQAQDAAVREQANRQRAEKSLARRTDLDDLLAPLEHIAGQLRSRHESAEFARMVADRLRDAYYRKG
jgi:hypothetical protein